MQYQEILQTQKYQDLQAIIFKRDNHACQRCGHTTNHIIPTISEKIAQYLEFTETDTLQSGIKIIKLNDEVLGQKYFKAPHDLRNPCNLIVQLAKKDTIQYPFNGSIINRIKPLPFEVATDFSQQLQKIFNLDFDVYEVDRYGLYIQNASSISPTKSELRIHHRCHRLGKEPWEQHHEDFVTLCGPCQRIVHEHQMIGIWGSDGSFKKNLKACWECGGTRQQGSKICLSCYGEGYQKENTKDWLNYLDSFLPWNG